MTEADSFGTLSGVMSYVQRGTLGSNSVPTETEALAFLVQRGALVEGIMAVAGVAYTPSTGSNPIPTSQSALGYMAKQLNEILAAVDVTLAYEVGQAPASSDKVKSLLDTAELLQNNLTAYIKDYVADIAGTPAVATDISSGGVEAAPFPPANSQKAQVIRNFTLDRENW